MTDVAKWCILRTSAGRTIPLAKSLADAGFVVWTPIVITRQQVRRGPVFVPVERSAPIAPTFVFGDADRLADFAAARVQPFSPHPDFSIFQWGNRVPIVGEAAIAGLRAEEAAALAAIEAVRVEVDREQKRRERAEAMRTERQRRKALRAERRALAPGLEVAVRDMPALAGLAGTVVESKRDGASAMVAFGGALVMEIEAWQLIPQVVLGERPAAA